MVKVWKKQESKSSRQWRIAMFAIFREEGCLRLAKLYGSGSADFRKIQEHNKRYPKRGNKGSYRNTRGIANALREESQ